MAEYIKPGIYINEYDKSSYITEGPTTITGICGTSAKGPANEVTLMTNYSEFVTTFGQDSGYLDFFARFFFKYGGNKLLVVRATDQFSFAGITNGIESIYQVKTTLAPSDTEIDIEYVSGADYTYWPDSGLVRLDYNGDTEYIVYRELYHLSGASNLQLLGCHRAVDSTTAITISTWGISVTPDATTDYFTSVTPHGLVNGQNVRFTGVGGGVSTGTDYWVINKSSYRFQITAVNGGTTPFNLTDATVNTAQKYPVPTKYIHVVTPVVCGNIVSGEGTASIALDGMKYGQLLVGQTIKFADISNTERVIRGITTAFSESARTQAITLTGSAPAAVDATWACVVPNPFYGEMGAYTLPMYSNYDAWALPKYDENGYVTKGAGISDPTEPAIFMNIYARSCGAWANTDVRVTVYTHATWDSATVTPYFKNKVDFAPSTDDELLVIVESVATGNIEESWLVSLIPTKVDYWGKAMFITDLINDYSNWIRVFVNPQYIAATGSAYNTPTSITYLPHSFERYYLGGGTDGASSITSLGIYSTPQVREFKIMAGYDLFADKNKVDVDLISAGGNQSLAIQANIKSICETRKDCVGILNIPWGLSITDAVRYKNLLGSTTYSAIYCNGSKVLDAFTGSYVTLPPAIQVTPLIVKTDLIRDPWYAVAGVNRGMLNEVIELEEDITEGDFETLYGAGINPIINDGDGPVIYGIKTMYTGSSAFNKLPIRRLMLKMEKDIKNSMKAFLFEPNTFDTRLRIVRTVEPYLESIKARDGIEDFRVVCDSTNNTNQTIAQGQIIVDIYIKPVFAAEYIIFNFTVTKDEISSIINNA
jgi:phage tail sheath protein FI